MLLRPPVLTGDRPARGVGAVLVALWVVGAARPVRASVPPTTTSLQRAGVEPAITDMDNEGVTDPFPETEERKRPVAPAILLTVAGGLAIAGGALARSSLKPECEDRRDVESCDTPNGADIGVRSGRLFASVGFGVGGAAFGAVGARALGHYLATGSADGSARRRKAAIGVGASAVALGAAGMVIGSTVFAINTRRASALGRTFEGATEPLSDEEVARLSTTLDHVDRARTGLMVLVAAPTFVATGIALLVTAPPAVTIAPTVSRSSAGLSLSGRF